MKTISTKEFTKTGATFSAEISDFGPSFKLPTEFMLLSDKTGQLLHMHYDTYETADTAAWTYKPVSESWRRLGPWASSIRVVFHND